MSESVEAGDCVEVIGSSSDYVGLHMRVTAARNNIVSGTVISSANTNASVGWSLNFWLKDIKIIEKGTPVAKPRNVRILAEKGWGPK